MLTDDEAREIQSGIDGGTRGPILLKWLRQLLEDRRERLAQQPAKAEGDDARRASDAKTMGREGESERD